MAINLNNNIIAFENLKDKVNLEEKYVKRNGSYIAKMFLER